MIKLEDWIDFIEGECNEKVRGQINLLLEHSETDRMVYANLIRLRQILVHADKANEIESLLDDDKRMLDLHNQIMQNIEANSTASRPLQASSSDQPSDLCLTQTVCKSE